MVGQAVCIGPRNTSLAPRGTRARPTAASWSSVALESRAGSLEDQATCLQKGSLVGVVHTKKDQNADRRTTTTMKQLCWTRAASSAGYFSKKDTFVSPVDATLLTIERIEVFWGTKKFTPVFSMKQALISGIRSVMHGSCRVKSLRPCPAQIG